MTKDLEKPINLNLDGLWRYAAEDDQHCSDPAFDDSAWDTMFIPSNWFLGGLDHHGVVWFRTEFQCDISAPYTSLNFDGVDYFTDVYLNGEHLGLHTGYFDPFSFDATSTLRPGKNVLAVRVESPYEIPGPEGWYLHKRLIKGVLNHHDCRPGGAWEPVGQSYNTGGIWNRVYLEQHGAVTIDRLLLRADMDSQPPKLNAELMIHNRSRKRRSRIVFRCTPENFKGKLQIFEFTADIPEGKSVHSLQMLVKDICIWQPWDRGFPFLYEVSASLIVASETVASSTLFGFRSVRVEPGFRWFINGNSYFPRGSNYLPTQWLAETLFLEAASGKSHPFGGCAGADLFKRDATLAKQANLNMLRVHAHVLPPEFHEACDRAGILVWQDFPLQWGYSDEPYFHFEAERQVRAMVAGLYNHPCIVTWCCHNESPWDAPWMAGQAGGIYDPTHNRDLDANLETIIRELDPSRYVHRNSGTGDGHVYPGWYVGHWRDFQDVPGSPFVTEYGAQGLPDRQSMQLMMPQFGPNAGFAELVRYKSWLDTQKKIGPLTKLLIRLGTSFWNLTERKRWKSIQEWIKGWGMKFERSTYKHIPSVEETPENLLHAREVWETWRFHDFQPPETFDNGIGLGDSLDQFISNSQAYQSHLIQYATECYRRAKYKKVTGIIQFDFSDPWPAVTWSVVDYWRTLKPAYDALRRSMQTVLPSFQIPDGIEEGKAIPVSFCVVNDLAQAFPTATCQWHLVGVTGDLASAAIPVDVPNDGVSARTNLTLPSLSSGKYKLLVTVVSDRKTIGENWYDLIVEQPRSD